MSIADKTASAKKQRLQFVEKVCFFKKVLVFNPKPLPRGEGLCMLCWLCIVQSLWAYTPGIRAGAILLGLPPLVPVGGFAPKQGCFGCLPKVLHDAKPAEQAILDTPFSKKYRFIDRLKPPCVAERLYKILFYDKCKVTCRITVYLL